MQTLVLARRWLLSPGNEKSALGGMLGVVLLFAMLLAVSLL